MPGATEAGGRRGNTDGGGLRAHWSGQLRKPHASVSHVAERARPRSAVAAASSSADGGEPYWTVSSSIAARTLSCRECKGVIYKGQPYVARDGRKIRLVSRHLHAQHTHTCTHVEPFSCTTQCYHRDCFSGDADPRTQSASSYHKSAYTHGQ